MSSHSYNCIAKLIKHNSINIELRPWGENEMEKQQIFPKLTQSTGFRGLSEFWKIVAF